MQKALENKSFCVEIILSEIKSLQIFASLGDFRGQLISAQTLMNKETLRSTLFSYTSMSGSVVCKPSVRGSDAIKEKEALICFTVLCWPLHLLFRPRAI